MSDRAFSFDLLITIYDIFKKISSIILMPDEFYECVYGDDISINPLIEATYNTVKNHTHFEHGKLSHETRQMKFKKLMENIGISMINVRYLCNLIRTELNKIEESDMNGKLAKLDYVCDLKEKLQESEQWLQLHKENYRFWERCLEIIV
jgi:hypothetical protein